MIGVKLANRYEILRELGRGGMGVVYLAYDPLLEREVAVKVVTSATLNSESEERFRREAKVIAKMDHPAIVVVYDTGEHDGSLFLVMPYVPGDNLRVLLQENSLKLGEVLEIGIQAAEALDYSHLRGIIHRDIKPENILVAREPDGIRIKITDFGLAVTATTENRLTRSGSVVGTIAYLSPEQLSSKELDGRSDLYSLATVLYECVSGETPFSGEIHSVLYKIAHDPPPAPISRGAQIDEELQRMILGCLEKEPALRPARAKDFAEDLERHRAKLRAGDSARLIPRSVSSMEIFRPTTSPLVGRDPEFHELQRRLNDALTGEECQFVMISGEAGTGKSRLLEELEKIARSRKIRVLHGRFVEQDRAFPFQGFCEMIQEYFRLRGTGSSAPADFSDLSAELISLFPLLSEVFETRSPAAGTPIPPDPASRKMENKTYIFELLARSLTRIAGGKPLMILLEDLHAAEVSVEALQYIVRRLGATPALVVATYRSNEINKRHPVSRLIDSFLSDRRFALIKLEPLGFEEHRELLGILLRGSRVGDLFARRIFEATEGNPYFTRELVRSLIDSQGILRSDSGSWMLSSDTKISTESLPATIQQTVEKRIEGLPEDLREVLQVASVLGRTFEFDELEMLMEGRPRLDEIIERLIQEGFIQEERESRGDRLGFSSGVIRDVLYASVSRRKRKMLHRKYAEYLEEHFAGKLERVYPMLLHHYQQVDMPLKVVDYGLRIARKSLASFSPEDALRTLRTVLEYAEDEEIESRMPEAEARAMLAAALRMTGNIDGALKELAQVVRISTEEKQPLTVVRALVQATETTWDGRRIEEAQRWLAAGLDAARSCGDNGALHRLLSLGATIANLRGEYDRARDYLKEAAEIEPPETQDQPLVRGGKITVPLPIAIEATHPVLIRLDEEAEVFSNVFDTLVTTDAAGNLVPHICERWETLEKGRSFLFTLRQGIRTHDGRVLTSREIKEAMEDAVRRKPSIPAFATIVGAQEFVSGAAQHIEGILAFRENKLGIQLSEPLPIYPAMLADVRTAIALEPSGVAEHSWMAGTGPFRIVAHDADRVILERNPDPWKESPILDSIEFRGPMDVAQIASGFRSGALDLAGDLRLQDLEELLRTQHFRGCIVESPKKNVYFLLFNTSSPFGSDPRIRKALCGLVSTHDLVWRTQGRFALPAEGLLPPGILGHDPGKRRHSHSPEGAIELLQSAAPQLPLRLTAAVHPVLQDRHASLTKALFKAWSDAGIEVSIANTDMPSYLDTAKHNQGIDFMIGRYVADYDDPDNFFYGLFHSRMGDFSAYVSSTQLDQMMEEARAETDTSLREKLYRRMENQLMESGVLLPLFHDVDYRLYNPRIGRLKLRSTAPHVNYSEIGLLESTASVAGRRQGGGILRVPIQRPVYNMDPALTFHTLQSEVFGNIFESLTRHAEGAQIAPWLAGYHTADGGRKFLFRLRENIRFHDGRRLTSRDVRYSFERLLRNRESQSRAWHLSPILGAQAVLDGRTDHLEGFRILSALEFEIELDQPVSFFPALLVSVSVAIIPEGMEKFHGSWRDGCVGTGPFRILHFEPGRILELEANPFYWRPGYPRAEGLIFLLDVPQSERLAGFLNGTYSLIWDISPSDVDNLRLHPEFASNYREIPGLSTYYLVFNIHEGPLQDELLRRQLSDLIDVEELVRTTTGRLAVPAHGLIPPGLLGYEPYSRSRAISSRMHRSGGGIDLNTMMHSVFDGPFQRFATELFGILKTKDLRVELQEIRSDAPNALVSAKADLILSRWIGDYPDADTFAHGLLQSEKGQMGRFCGNSELDWLIEKGRTETDPKLRHSIYREIEEMISRRALMLPLFHEQSCRFARPEVADFELSFARPNLPYEKLWLKRQS